MAGIERSKTISNNAPNKHGAKKKGTVKNLKTGQVLGFLYNPETLDWRRGTTFNEISAPGTSYPKFQYGSGGSAGFTLRLLLDGSGGFTGLVKEQRDFFKALQPPMKSDDLFSAPPVCLISLGEEIRQCILLDYDETILEFDPETMAPRLVELSLEFKEVA